MGHCQPSSADPLHMTGVQGNVKQAFALHPLGLCSAWDGACVVPNTNTNTSCVLHVTMNPQEDKRPPAVDYSGGDFAPGQFRGGCKKKKKKHRKFRGQSQNMCVVVVCRAQKGKTAAISGFNFR